MMMMNDRVRNGWIMDGWNHGMLLLLLLLKCGGLGNVGLKGKTYIDIGHALGADTTLIGYGSVVGGSRVVTGSGVFVLVDDVVVVLVMVVGVVVGGGRRLVERTKVPANTSPSAPQWRCG
jgi:hypothetical protein